MELKLLGQLSQGELSGYKYKLISFIVREGDLDSGYYWTYGKDSFGRWYKYDDKLNQNVPDVTNSINNILSSGKDESATPYIFIYKLSSPEDQLKDKLVDLKLSLQELKAKLQALQGKLGALKGKLKPNVH
jgi:hypothetical protein